VNCSPEDSVACVSERVCECAGSAVAPTKSAKADTTALSIAGIALTLLVEQVKAGRVEDSE
jgi:hypothetical protein